MIKRIARLIIVGIMAWNCAYPSTVAAALDEGEAMPTEVVSPEKREDVEQVSATSLPVPTLPSFVVAAPALVNLAVLSEPPTVPLAEDEESPLVLPPLLINRVVAGILGQASYEYIELFNPNSHDVELDSWRVRVLRKEGSGTAQEFVLNGIVKARTYVLLAGVDSELDTPSPDFRLKPSSSIIVNTGGIVQLVDGVGIAVEQLRWGDTTNPALSLATDKMLTRTYIEGVPSLTGDNLKDFITQPIGQEVPRGGGYVSKLEPVNRCEGLKISEIVANVSDNIQFIELYNAANALLTLDGCLLQTNRSTTANLTLTGTLQPAEYRAVSVAGSGLILTKTTSGTVYLLSSDGEEEIDERSYDGLAEEASWSWFGGADFRQTFTRTPGRVNVWQEFLPCENGYERNTETGRCRKIIIPEIVADCALGQYRSEETNRCRSITTAASTITPCQVGQYRNPETNRCRSLATATSELTPCREGQERNPETNRCRLVNTTMPAAAFGVEPVVETGKAFAGWWALGGVGILAAGYGAWEWRREVLGGVRKLGSFFTSSK